MIIGSTGHSQNNGLANAHTKHVHDKKAHGGGGDDPKMIVNRSSSEPQENSKSTSLQDVEFTHDRLKQLQQLKTRGREVRAHEASHAAAGGQYAGAPSYSYQRGPDGHAYAVGGEVSISVSPETTPEATIRKMEVVRRAALAPADPSPQDRQVAQSALATKMQAQAELAIQDQEKMKEVRPLRIKESGDEALAEDEEKSAVTESAETQKTAGQLKTEQLFDTSPATPAAFFIQA